MTRRYRWPPEVIDNLPAGWAEEHVLKAAAWDEAVAKVRLREQRKQGRGPEGGRHRRPIYGMQGAEAPEGGV